VSLEEGIIVREAGGISRKAEVDSRSADNFDKSWKTFMRALRCGMWTAIGLEKK
jgi:hypothetical protein